MIYIDDTFKELQDGNGLSLCKAWFLTKAGYSYDKKIVKSFDKVKLNEVSQYKIINNEILLIGNTYVVGNGKGTIIYSPCRENEDVRNYLDGKSRINKKYEVTIE